MAKKELTTAQAKALNDAEAYFKRAYDEARARLSATDFGSGSAEPHFECMRCDCDGYTPPKHGGGNCKTPRCGHSFFSHNIPT
jgi:hypothetical protein